ncbi:MAG: hypothetical protein K2L52_04835 [Clostridia bacterium]|nr:hypothetical protein [Clostridia bacterium]
MGKYESSPVSVLIKVKRTEIEMKGTFILFCLGWQDESEPCPTATADNRFCA